MADSQPVPREPNRLTKRRSPDDLARELLRTEWDLSRGNRGQEQSQGPDIGERLWRALRDTWRSLTGRSRRGYEQIGAGFDGGGYGGAPYDQGGYGQGGYGQGQGGTGPYGGGPEGDRFGRGGKGPAPEQGQGQRQEQGQGVSGPGQEPRELTRLKSEISNRLRTSHTEHEAFEDALMKLVTSGKWKDRFRKSPESMPLVAEYVANAHTRKALRESAQEADRQNARSSSFTERFVRPPRQSAASTDAPADGATRTTEHQLTEQRRPSPPAESRIEGVDGNQTLDGQGFLSVEQQRVDRVTAPPPESRDPGVSPTRDAPAESRERDLLASSPPDSLAAWAAMTPDPVLSEQRRGEARPDSRLAQVDSRSYDSQAFTAAPPEQSERYPDSAHTDAAAPTGLDAPAPPTSPPSPAQSRNPFLNPFLNPSRNPFEPPAPVSPVSPETPRALLGPEGLKSTAETRGPVGPSTTRSSTPTRPVAPAHTQALGGGGRSR
ncbi:hypothetical protein ACWGPD_29515 [Streptomyces hirsutus]|uniref:hypothetical protein n=1 Tax=Streptomyces hirsutus TaxID=35620 RepID=UPI003644CE43